MQDAYSSKTPETAPKYTAVPSGELGLSDELLTGLMYESPRSWNAMKKIAFVCIGFIAGILSAMILLRIEGSRSDIAFTSCGHKAEQARANGCIYEPYQRSWIPPECYFSEPGQEYDDPFSDRKWFLDVNLTQPATETTLEGLRRGDNITAYTRYWHDEHCLYLWRKMGIAMEKGLTSISSKIADLEHTAHCSKYIAKKLVEAESGNQTFPFKGFPDHSGSPLMFQTCALSIWAHQVCQIRPSNPMMIYMRLELSKVARLTSRTELWGFKEEKKL